ncbi:DUF3592 domain-containing protein [Gloeomargarita sp.]
MSDRQLLGMLSTGIGALVFSGGLFSLHKTRTFLATAARATGEVIALERRWSRRREGGSSCHYYPVVQFQLPNGRWVQFTGQVGSTPPAYRVGQRVEVLYPPGQPHAARLCSFLELWFGPILFTGMGGLFLLMGGVSLIRQFLPR